MLQQLTRIRTSEGSESVHGTLLAEFALGQRDATLYVAFCPPFERLPEIEAHVADDSDASVKVAQRLHQGAQFDVRLAKPAAGALRVCIEFFAGDADVVSG